LIRGIHKHFGANDLKKNSRRFNRENSGEKEKTFRWEKRGTGLLSRIEEREPIELKDFNDEFACSNKISFSAARKVMT